MEETKKHKEIGMGILKFGSIHKNPLSATLQEVQERPSVTFIIDEEDLKKSLIVQRYSAKMPLSPPILKNIGRMETTEEDDDDYSASVSAMLQRKSSRRSSKRKKRTSTSYFVDDSIDLPGNSRRRSSVFTTSSGDTAISIDIGMDDEIDDQTGTQEQIYDKMKIHKEVLSSVKHQPWPLKKKLKLVRQAKSYIKRHEGALQERLAQSRNTRDTLTRVSIFISKKWQYCKREIVNLQKWLIPWEIRIKEIESHFGSAVASYFTFLRWLFWINLVISLTLIAFVTIPEFLKADKHLAGDRKILFPDERKKSKNFLTFWEFEGIVKHSPFFYGWYTNWDLHNGGYRLPLAYFVANLVVYVYSFVAILRKMAENSRMSKLSEKEDECAFSWKVFTGWDFMIGNPETAINRIASIVLSFKESLLEEAEKEKKLGHWKIITVRVFVNLSVIFLLILSAYAVVVVVERSMEIEENDNSGWWRQNEITVVMSLISYIFPIFFEILGIFENYHPRKQLRLQLARIMVLNLLNLYSLIIALFDKINHMETELQNLKPKEFRSQFITNLTETNCKYEEVSCSEMLARATMSSFVNKSRKRSVVKRSLTALSLILLPTSTIKPPFTAISLTSSSTPTTSISFPRINDSPDEIMMGMNGVLDYGSTNVFPGSESPNETLLALDDEGVIWQEYNEGTESTGNYDDYDENGIYPNRNVSPTTIDKFVDESKIEKCIVKQCDVQHNRNDWEKNQHRNTKVSLDAISKLNMTTKKKLRRLCWETMFGQELAKLTVMDLVLTIIATLIVDFFRAVFVRYMNNCWCWDLEKQFPQYGDFKIAENILHLVNNQGMVWMGMFFSPGLTALNVLKLGILMHLRSWAVMTCNVPHEVVFRASRSNNFYLALLLTMIFLCVLPVGYAIVWVEPSWHCGPFAGYYRIYYLATQSIKAVLPEKAHKALDYIASPGIVIPLIVLMVLIIYYMVSLAGSLREANNDLKIQLRYERTEERRKMFKIAEKRGQDTTMSKWRKILPSLSSNKTDSRGIINLLQHKRQRMIEQVRSTSDADEMMTDADPNSFLQDLSFRQDDEIDENKDIVLSSNGTKKETQIPEIKIDSIDINADDGKNITNEVDVKIQNEIKKDDDSSHD